VVRLYEHVSCQFPGVHAAMQLASSRLDRRLTKAAKYSVGYLLRIDRGRNGKEKEIQEEAGAPPVRVKGKEATARSLRGKSRTGDMQVPVNAGSCDTRRKERTTRRSRGRLTKRERASCLRGRVASHRIGGCGLLRQRQRGRRDHE
jgi:hypothetical protein